MDTVKQNEVLLKAGKGWLYFSQPHEILVALTLEDVPGVLNEIERQVERHGWHAAGFISYEAAPAFDPALLSRLLGDFPYLWFGLYSQPDPVALPRPLHPRRSLDWKPTVDRASYNAAIDQVRDYIARGRTYQVNYTMRLQANPAGCTPRSL